MSSRCLEDAADSSGTNNILLVDLALQLAQESLQDTGRKIEARTTEQKKALRWLESVDLVEDSILSPSATTVLTEISEPTVVSNTSTTFSKRQLLLDAGWVSVSGRVASSASQKLNGVQCLQYYHLLLDEIDKVLVQEKSGWFSHSQPPQYYKTLVCAFELAGDASETRRCLVMLCNVACCFPVLCFFLAVEKQDF